MSQITIPLDIESLEIISQTVDVQGNIVLEVKSKKRESTCHKCGKSATKRYGSGPIVQVQHLPIFDTPVHLKIRSVRYQCEHCDDHPVTTEQYDWCERGSKITNGLTKHLMRNMIHSTIQDVSRKDKLQDSCISLKQASRTTG